LDAIEDAVDNGVVVVDNTQCLKGGVVFSYAAGAVGRSHKEWALVEISDII